MEPVSVAASRAIPVTVQDAYERTLPLDLPVLFRHWYGPLPPIISVRGQKGTWGSPGQTRTVVLRGGGTMLEELLLTNPPDSFSYQLTRITGPLSPLVRRVSGEWRFAPLGTGTNVTWRWTMEPTSTISRPVVALLGRLWDGYAQTALAELSDRLLLDR